MVLAELVAHSLTPAAPPRCDAYIRRYLGAIFFSSPHRCAKAPSSPNSDVTPQPQQQLGYCRTPLHGSPSPSAYGRPMLTEQQSLPGLIVQVEAAVWLKFGLSSSTVEQVCLENLRDNRSVDWEYSRRPGSAHSVYSAAARG